MIFIKNYTMNGCQNGMVIILNRYRTFTEYLNCWKNKDKNKENKKKKRKKKAKEKLAEENLKKEE